MGFVTFFTGLGTSTNSSSINAANNFVFVGGYTD